MVFEKLAKFFWGSLLFLACSVYIYFGLAHHVCVPASILQFSDSMYMLRLEGKVRWQECSKNDIYSCFKKPTEIKISFSWDIFKMKIWWNGCCWYFIVTVCVSKEFSSKPDSIINRLCPTEVANRYVWHRAWVFIPVTHYSWCQICKHKCS